MNGLAEHLPRLRIDVVAQQQARVVVDVLDRVRQIVHDAGGDTAEHRLSLFLLDVLLELRQPVGHGVERGAEPAELVAAPDGDAGVELTRGDVVRGTLQREDRIDERSSEQVSDCNRDEESGRNRDHQLPFELGRAGIGLSRRLLDDDRPIDLRDCRRDSEHRAAVVADVLA